MLKTVHQKRNITVKLHSIMSLAPGSELTLFLWLEGFFPKQVVYYLLITGLASSPELIYQGKTNDPRLNINIIHLTEKGFESTSPNDPKPAGKSMPCLRIVDPISADKSPIWIEESAAVLAFLEENYKGKLSMTSPTMLDRAKMQDIRSPIVQSFAQFNHYITHAAAVTTSWSGIKNEDRNLTVARRAKRDFTSSLRQAQTRAEASLQTHGWLTPGLAHPGINDVVLASAVRYMELSYAFDMLEDAELGLLRDWYRRFKQAEWWNEVEEQGRHPKLLRHPASCREV